MLTYGFGSFFNLLPGGDVSSLLLIYGMHRSEHALPLSCISNLANLTPTASKQVTQPAGRFAGFVISLLGFALAYAQLVPVPCKTTQEAFDLREAQATDIQKQVQSGCSIEHCAA